MKKHIRRGVLVVMSLLPLSSVATAAESALLEMVGEEQSEGLNNWHSHRLAIMPIGTQTISIEGAWQYFSSQKEASGAIPTESEFNNHLESLIEKGIIEVDELMVRGLTPSIY